MELGFGRGGNGTITVVLQLLRQHGVRFTSIDSLSKLNPSIDPTAQSEDTGSEVASIMLTPQDLAPLSSVPVVFKLVSDTPKEDAEWKKIGSSIQTSK